MNIPEVYIALLLLCSSAEPVCDEAHATLGMIHIPFENRFPGEQAKRPCINVLRDQLQYLLDEAGEGVVLRFECRRPR